MVALAQTPDSPNGPNVADLRHRITVEAIQRWQAARDLWSDATIAAARTNDRSLDLLEEATRLALEVAEAALLNVILIRDESIKPCDLREAIFEAHRPIAVEFEGRTYLAASREDLDPGQTADDESEQVVRLIVIDPGDVVAA